VPGHFLGAEGAFVELGGLGGASDGEISHHAAQDGGRFLCFGVAVAADVVAMSFLLCS
jgi:hypothetical protein